MESLAEQTDLGNLLYQGEGQAGLSLELQVREDLPEAAPHDFPARQQQDQAENTNMASEDIGDELQTLTGLNERALDATSQLNDEARSNLESSAALDIATRRSLLLGRMKQKHVCHVCGRECPSKHKLKRHLSTHSEERPFNCHVCGKSFKWTEYLAKHMRQQHKGEAMPSSVGTSHEGTSTSSMDDTQQIDQSLTLPGEQDASNLDVCFDSSMDTSMDISLDGSAHPPPDTTESIMGECSVFTSDITDQHSNSAPQGNAPQAECQDYVQSQHLPAPELIPVQPHDMIPTSISQQISEIMPSFNIPIPESIQPLSHSNLPPETTMGGISTSVCGSYPSHIHPVPNPGTVSLNHNTYPVELVTQPVGTQASDLFNVAVSQTGFEMQSSILPSYEMPNTAASIGLNAMQPHEDTSSQTAEPSLPVTQPVTITREEVVREPPPKRAKKETVSVGIQCDVGHETLEALREEEAAQAQGIYPQNEDLEINANAIRVPDDGDKPVLVLPREMYREGVNPCNEGSRNIDLDQVLSPTERMIQKYPCEVDGCSKAYIHRKDLIRHMKIRHGVSPQKLEPVVMETPEKPYACTVGTCNRSYFHMKDLRRHQRQCHTVNPANEEIQPSEFLEDGKVMLRFPCDFPGCSRSYVHKKDLVRHKRLYHKDSSNKPSVPVPLRYSENELKRIRQEEKTVRGSEGENDENFEKGRLDSIGSTISTSGTEDPPNSAALTDTEAESELTTLARLDHLASAPSIEGFHNPNALIATPVPSNNHFPQPEEVHNTTQGTLDLARHQGVPEIPQDVYAAVTASMGYDMGTFTGAGGNSVYSFAEQPQAVMMSAEGQHQQQSLDSNHHQYDPTAVLTSLHHVATSGPPTSPRSLQNVVNQLFQGASELSQDSF